MVDRPPLSNGAPNSGPHVNIHVSEAPVVNIAHARRRKAGPRGYDMRTDGLYATSAEGPSIRIAWPAFDIVSRLATRTGERCGILLQWIGEGGCAKEHEVRNSALVEGRGQPLCAALMDKGLHIRPASAPAFVDYLAQVSPSELRMVAGPTGWADGGFALPDTFYKETGEIELCTVHGPNKYLVSGTLEDWQQKVAGLAVGNPGLMFAISGSLVGPLLRLAGLEGFGEHQSGDSTRGKTTELRAGASVWGKGDTSEDGFIILGASTTNSLEGLAEEHNDTGLFIDEIGLMGKDLNVSIFKLTGGVGKNRADRAGNRRDSKHWTTHCRSTSNHSLAELMKDANSRDSASGGYAVRIVDLARAPGDGCFAELHGFAGAKEFADFLGSAATKYYGSAGREFLKQLVPDKAELREEVLRGMNEFEARVCKAGSAAQVRRVAKNFGLVAAAGELAIAFGIVPWPPGSADDAAAVMFTGWVAQRGGYGDHEGAIGLRAIREFIEAKRLDRFIDARTTRPDLSYERTKHVRDIAGYIVAENGERIFAFTEAGFREACGGAPPKTVAKELLQKKLLLEADKGHSAKRTTITLPGEKTFRPRLYCVRDAILEAQEGAAEL
jgi:putative DNA primase/helicase